MGCTASHGLRPQGFAGTECAQGAATDWTFRVTFQQCPAGPAGSPQWRSAAAPHHTAQYSRFRGTSRASHSTTQYYKCCVIRGSGKPADGPAVSRLRRESSQHQLLLRREWRPHFEFEQPSDSCPLLNQPPEKPGGRPRFLVQCVPFKGDWKPTNSSDICSFSSCALDHQAPPPDVHSKITGTHSS